MALSGPYWRAKKLGTLSAIIIERIKIPLTADDTLQLDLRRHRVSGQS
jgi:hypothetical protein